MSTLSSVPPGTTQVRLKFSDAQLDKDMATYPYLTEDTEVGGKRAERQRPVGRYKLDSRGHKTFDDYFQTLWYDILEHYQEVDYIFREDRDSYNIFLLYSLGGGTGSGTFPLLSAMLNRIAQRIKDQNDNRRRVCGRCRCRSTGRLRSGSHGSAGRKDVLSALLKMEDSNGITP